MKPARGRKKFLAFFFQKEKSLNHQYVKIWPPFCQSPNRHSLNRRVIPFDTPTNAHAYYYIACYAKKYKGFGKETLSPIINVLDTVDLFFLSFTFDVDCN